MSTRAVGTTGSVPLRGYTPTSTAGPAASNSWYSGQNAGTVGGVADGFSQFVQAGSSLFGGGAQGGGDAGGSQGSNSIAPMPKFKSPILEKANQKAEASPTGSGDKAKESSRSVVFEDEGGGDYGGE